MSAMLALISASRSATTQGAHTLVPVGLVTVSDMMAAPATVSPLIIFFFFPKVYASCMDASIFFLLLDINECTAGSSSCHQNCHNAVGSYACSCYSGYRLNSDGVSCRGKAMNYNF